MQAVNWGMPELSKRQDCWKSGVLIICSISRLVYEQFVFAQDVRHTQRIFISTELSLPTYIKTLNYESIFVIDASCGFLAPDRSHVLFEIAFHNHYLPFGSISGDTPELGTSSAPRLYESRFVFALNYYMIHIRHLTQLLEQQSLELFNFLVL